MRQWYRQWYGSDVPSWGIGTGYCVGDGQRDGLGDTRLRHQHRCPAFSARFRSRLHRTDDSLSSHGRDDGLSRAMEYPPFAGGTSSGTDRTPNVGKGGLNTLRWVRCTSGDAVDGAWLATPGTSVDPCSGTAPRCSIRPHRLNGAPRPPTEIEISPPLLQFGRCGPRHAERRRRKPMVFSAVLAGGAGAGFRLPHC